MLPLPKGISGFGEVEGNRIELDEFKRICYHLMIVFQFQGFELIDTYSGNYYIGKLMRAGNNRDIFILMNQCYPILSFADEYEYGNINFVEESTIAEYLSNLEYRLTSIEGDQITNYKVITLEKLNVSLSDSLIEGLHKEEKKQIDYWRPSKVKDIIFNNWD